MKIFSLITAVIFFVASQRGWAQQTATNAAVAAWKRLQATTELPAPPEEWLSTPPSQDKMLAFLTKYGQAAIAAADKARAFYTQFPDSTNAFTAKLIECAMLKEACVHGNQDAFEAWAKAQKGLLEDPRLTGKMRYGLRLQIAERIKVDPHIDDKTREADVQNQLWQLVKDYPNQEDAYAILLNLAEQAPADQAISIAKKILAARQAPEDIKGQAEAILQHASFLGKPLDIKFTAVDGRPVDLSKMKGKVVLVDFWATWCVPCREEMPDVQEAYNKYHSKGLEVVGISFDHDKDALIQFTREKNIPWPQYFDSEGEIGMKYGITTIPAMWLVDKNGNLATEDAREDLDGDIEKLLGKN